MSYKWSNKSIRRAEEVSESLFKCATIALSKSKHDMSVAWRGGFRTAEEQLEIYSRGASSKDGTIKKSYHQSGNAIDIIPFGIDYNLGRVVKGKDKVPKEYRHFAMLMFSTWQEMLLNGEVIGVLEWGGNWTNFIDVPHWQVKFK